MRFVRMIQAVDAHAAGEPGRVIVGGVLDVAGRDHVRQDAVAGDQGDDLRPADAPRAARLSRPRTCNLVLPSNHPEADAGYVIMEQVEYPGMSGTNTICVVTALLETGMLPMAEPMTELVARGAGRAHPGPRDVRRRQGDRRHVPKRTGVRGLPRRACRGAAAGHRHGRRRVRRHVLRDRRAEAFGLRLMPDEGRDITRVTEMIKAAANEQLPVVHPEQPGFAGITIGQLSGPAHDPANSCGTP